MENNNNKVLIVLVVILSLVVVGLGGYIFYDKAIKVGDKEVEKDTSGKENKKEEDKKEEDKKEEDKNNLTSAEIKELADSAYAMIGSYTGGNLAMTDLDLDLYRGKTLEQLTSKQKLQMVMLYEATKKDIKSACSDERGTSFNFNEIGSKLFKDLSFLNEFKNKSETQELAGYSFTSTDSTIFVSSGCGGEGLGGDSYTTKLMDYKVENNKLLITVAAAFYKISDSDNAIYVNDEGVNVVLYNVYNIFDKENAVETDVEEFTWSKYNTYTAVFDISDNGLYFEKLTKN